MCKIQQDWNKDGHNAQDNCVVNICSVVLQKKKKSNNIEITILIALSGVSVARNFKLLKSK